MSLKAEFYQWRKAWSNQEEFESSYNLENIWRKTKRFTKIEKWKSYSTRRYWSRASSTRSWDTRFISNMWLRNYLSISYSNALWADLCTASRYLLCSLTNDNPITWRLRKAVHACGFCDSCRKPEHRDRGVLRLGYSLAWEHLVHFDVIVPAHRSHET